MKTAGLLVLLLSAACKVGPSLENSATLSIDPRGAAGQLRVGEVTMPVEVITVTDSTMLVLTEGIYALVRLEDISQLRLPSHDIALGRTPYRYRTLAPITRFPHGVSPAILAQLLQSTGQAQLRRIERRR